MKSQFLKIAGVKSEKAFYKKYPSEAAFFKAHPEAKKMANGGEQDMGQLKKLQQLTDFGNPPIAQFGKKTKFNPVNPYQTYDPNFQMGQLDTQGLTSLGGQPTGFGTYVANQDQSGRALKKNYSKMFGNFQSGQDISTGIDQSVSEAAGGAKGLGDAASFIQPGMDIIKGIGMLGQQKKAKQEAKQSSRLTGVMAQAAATREEPIRRQYVRPEDAIIDPNQLFPSYGVGTNILAEDGAMIGGNPTEIQNTYDPNAIYTDLGYEPLNDSEQVKAYRFGGEMRKGQFGLSESLNSGGFGDFMTDGGGDMINKLTSQVGSGGYGPTAGNTIGGGLGQAAGTIFGGPVGGMIGKALGNVVGGLFDPTGRQIKQYQDESNRNIGSIVGQQFGQGVQQQFGSYLEDGGYVSNDWTPQVIAKFGEYDLKDLLAPDETMNTLRSGGNLRGGYTAPRPSGLQTMAMGGDLQVYRGEAETISTNPYLPDGGETVMFRGPSHADGGMPITYGQSPVEVEGGEPAVKLQDGGTGEENMVVFGNLKIPNQFVGDLDPKAKGKKFKNYVNDLSKIEAKQNKIIDKSTNELDDLTPLNSFDQLKMSSLQANLMGGNMKLKDVAEKKQTAAALQSAINDTAEEQGLVADSLAKGKAIVDKSKDGKAKYGAAIEKAQTGIYKTKGVQPGAIDYNALGQSGDPMFVDEQSYTTLWMPKVTEAFNDPERAKKIIAGIENYTGQDAEDVKAAIAKEKTLSGKIAKAYELGTDKKVGPYHNILSNIITTVTPQPTTVETTTLAPIKTTTTTAQTTKAKFPWMDIANQAIQEFRPSDAEQLDPNQLMGEMYALSNNQLEPVQAQKYSPQLLTPYDISLQDQLNENQSTFNSVARQVAGDPSALSALAAQKYSADSKVLGEQMRLNQAQKAGIYNQNIATLNDAQLKNLNILDQQYGRQAQAKSNTKATTQGALNSISSKYAQNKLANRELATYENLYNYRYDPNFRARNMNPLVDFQKMIENASPSQLAEYNKIIEKKNTPAKTESKTSRNGSIVKALKNL